jgi:hypothetical protein
MSGLEVSDITNAYTAVRDDKNPTNWLLLTNPPSDSLLPRGSLVLSQTGTGGLAELRDALLHDGCDTEVAYGYVRIEYANDAESTRTKFALIVWIGEHTRIMRKARVSIEAGEVAQVLNHASIQISAGSKDDLKEDDIISRLRKAGGADYNGGRR